MRAPLRCARAYGARKRFSYYLFAALKRRSSTFALRVAARGPSSTPSRCSVPQGRAMLLPVSSDNLEFAGKFFELILLDLKANKW